MRIKLKKTIEEKLEPIMLEKGFNYDLKLSSPSAAVYTYVKYPDKGFKPNSPKAYKLLPPLEYITIYKSSFDLEITVHLFSNITGVARTGILSYLAGKGPGLDWWPIRTKEQAEVAFAEIKEFLEKYAWDWFVLK